ncbi:glycoside hydrolase family 5 protein [Patellaria atrata CBS 101060]|uniref:cellulase n=1 Tax=Patellaria atrata CBS 101060 TaxID=1346257 RepID=A0A9P4VUI8_9PEZI|nr:glycoside hydrolase family 5 protein [Patellaria atrata CBS 101060]
MRLSSTLLGAAAAATVLAERNGHTFPRVGARQTTTNTSEHLQWWGINLSGAEFGNQNFSGVYGREYIWYDFNAIDTFLAQGMNHFRINFLMERLTPNELTAPLDPYYAGNLSEQTVSYITQKGAYVQIQPHNYGRFYNEIITDVAGFETWWKNVATPYVDNDLVIFDTNNEYHDMDQQLVFDLNQAAINGIRAAGALTQYITPEGNSWTGAWTWVSSGNGASLINLKDPADMLIYQMHQYLDTDGSGTHEECVSATIFRERLVAATNWLKQNNQKGIIGEFAGGANEQCIKAIQDGLTYLRENRDVWTGALWWAAGPWWGDYMYSMEPPSGPAYTGVLPQIKDYV